MRDIRHENMSPQEDWFQVNGCDRSKIFVIFAEKINHCRWYRRLIPLQKVTCDARWGMNFAVLTIDPSSSSGSDDWIISNSLEYVNKRTQSHNIKTTKKNEKEKEKPHYVSMYAMPLCVAAIGRTNVRSSDWIDQMGNHIHDDMYAYLNRGLVLVFFFVSLLFRQNFIQVSVFVSNFSFVRSFDFFCQWH